MLRRSWRSRLSGNQGLTVKAGAAARSRLAQGHRSKFSDHSSLILMSYAL